MHLDFTQRDELLDDNNMTIQQGVIGALQFCHIFLYKVKPTLHLTLTFDVLAQLDCPWMSMLHWFWLS